MRRTFPIVVVLALAVGSGAGWALEPDDELWIPAAARGAGNAGAVWMTDLALLNLGAEDATVELTWLERDADNSQAEGVEVTVAAGTSLVLDDVILTTFGAEAAAGAIHVEVVEDEDKAGDDEVELVASARIYNLDEGETFGQGFAGLTSDAAIAADGGESTHAIAVTDNAAFRTNWYGLNISEDDESDEAEAAEVLVELLTADGEVLASNTYVMPPFAPLLQPVAALGAGEVEHATLRFTMLEGEGLFGASMVDQESNDPTTLEAHWDCSSDDDAGTEEFTDEFFVDDCTFASTGHNPLFILEPGFQLVLEGEEDGEVVAATITVLDETFMVDGVETRVVEERETVDGELEEVSRNFFAHCVETGSVFYFGEEVDIYEDGVVVDHHGAWLAGVDGAEAGIIMPGTILAGSRYYQEIAPGVALDRAEHVAVGLTVTTPAGTFEGCLEVEDSSGLDPTSRDRKVYCHGIGNVVDEVMELVSFTDPSP